MASKDDYTIKNLYHTLTNTDVPASNEEFSLEEILAEFGGSLEERLLQQAESPEGGTPSPEEEKKREATSPVSEPEAPSEPAEKSVPAPEPAEEAPPPVRAEVDVEALRDPHTARSISIEEVVNSTVEAVMEEEAEPILPSRRGLFSRRKMEDTEPLAAPPEPEPDYDPEPIGPEPDLDEAARDCREAYIARKKSLIPPLITALLPTAALIAERRGLTVPGWSGDPVFQSAALLMCLALTALLCRHALIKAVLMLSRRRCVSELLMVFSALAAAADCVVRLKLPERSAVMPYAPVSCLALVFAQWGVRRESRGDYDMFRSAAIDGEPPYLVTDTQRGACKQRGSVPGFYTAAVRDNAACLWQTALLPVFGVAAFVFAGLSSFGQGRDADFFLNLSAILAAAATFSLPLSWSLPWSKLAGHLQKAGASVAGWSGAQKISRKRCMIVTDGDLFPAGTIQLNGSRLYGEEMAEAASLAASLARTAGCGLERFFDSLLRSEGGAYEDVDDFSFYEEGGYSGMIHGQSVLMGTGPFLRKMGVRLPGDVNLKTGVFLAVDKRLVAVFAVKYNPSENVDFALKMMRRSHILPILASRDSNITPALLRRKFSRNLRLEYPDLSERVALSEAEQDRGLPRALLFREGLLPYAETVAGSLRLCRAVRWAAALSLLGSWAGTLLSFYLVSLGAYELLNPLALEMFLLLWTLPVLLMADWTGRY